MAPMFMPEIEGHKTFACAMPNCIIPWSMAVNISLHKSNHTTVCDVLAVDHSCFGFCYFADVLFLGFGALRAYKRVTIHVFIDNNRVIGDDVPRARVYLEMSVCVLMVRISIIEKMKSCGRAYFVLVDINSLIEIEFQL